MRKRSLSTPSLVVIALIKSFVWIRFMKESILSIVAFVVLALQKTTTLNQFVKELSLLIPAFVLLFFQKKVNKKTFMKERNLLNAKLVVLALHKWNFSKSHAKTLTLFGLLMETPQISVLYFPAPRFSLIWKSSSSSRKNTQCYHRDYSQTILKGVSQESCFMIFFIKCKLLVGSLNLLHFK